MLRRVSCAAVVLLLLWSVSCTPNNGYVAREWASTMRELGIVPVFPPREDIHVGDVYLFNIRDNEEQLFKEDIGAFLKKKGAVPLGAFVVHINVNRELSDFYNERLSFPRTSVATSITSASVAALQAEIDDLRTRAVAAAGRQLDAISSNGNPGQASLTAPVAEIVSLNTNITTTTSNAFGIVPMPQANYNIFETGGPDSTSRLRTVGFPNFMSSTMSAGNLSALIPAEAVMTSLALRFSNAKTVTVSVPLAEWYCLPANKLAMKFLKYTDGEPRPEIAFEGNDALCALCSNDEAAKTIQLIGGLNITGKSNWFVVINEVYYARAIDVSIETRSDFGGALGINANAATLAAAAAKDSALAQLTSTRASAAQTAAASRLATVKSFTNPPATTAELAKAQREFNAAETGNVVAGADATAAANRAATAQTAASTTAGTAGSTIPVPGGAVNFLNSNSRMVGLRRMYDRPVAIGVRGFIVKLSKENNKLYAEQVMILDFGSSKSGKK